MFPTLSKKGKRMRNFISRSIENAIGGRVAGFYDTITSDTCCVIHDRGDRFEIFLTRKSSDQYIGDNCEEITKVLVDLDFQVSIPLRYVDGYIVPNGLKLVATTNATAPVLLAA